MDLHRCWQMISRYHQCIGRHKRTAKIRQRGKYLYRYDFITVATVI